MTRRGEDALRSSPSVVLAFAPEGLPRPAPEENARASHLVGQHYLGDSAVSSRAPRQTARPISSFLRLHFIRLVVCNSLGQESKWHSSRVWPVCGNQRNPTDVRNQYREQV